MISKDDDIYDAVTSVLYAFDMWDSDRCSSPVLEAVRLVELNEAVQDLRTFHPGYNYESGTMPWDRDEED